MSHNHLSRYLSAASGLALGVSLSVAQALAAQPDARAYQAFGYEVQIDHADHGHWHKANGAQILGGFAGPDDEVNDETGEVRRR